jgi:hypothetical protein
MTVKQGLTGKSQCIFSAHAWFLKLLLYVQSICIHILPRLDALCYCLVLCWRQVDTAIFCFATFNVYRLVYFDYTKITRINHIRTTPALKLTPLRFRLACWRLTSNPSLYHSPYYRTTNPYSSCDFKRFSSRFALHVISHGLLHASR